MTPIPLTDSRLYLEIHQQPEVLRRLLDLEQPAVTSLAKAINQRGVSHVLIAARGTSDNAARYAQYLWGAINRLPVALAAPSLFSIYNQPPKVGNALVLGISQSGKSPDIVAVLAEARRQGALTAAITNEPDSDLANQADHVIALHAGEEKSVAATKTYTAELAAIAMLSAALTNDVTMRTALEALPNAIIQTLTLNETIQQVAPRYRYMQHCVVIGRGYNYATAFELALKMKELTYTIVEPYSSADFLHGPLALVEPGFPVIVIAPTGAMLADMQTFTGKLAERGAEVIAISDHANLLAHARIPICLPAPLPEWLSPLAAIIPGQLLAMHLAYTRDYPVDQPRGLLKVTETR